MSQPRPDVFVRLALPRDVAGIAAIQARAWAAAYGEMLPRRVLDSLEPAAREQWALALAAPPTDAHHVLVALAGDDVAGFAAVSPSADPDQDPHVSGQLAVLAIDPARQRAGHGSRLLATAVETLRTARFTLAVSWVPAGDTALIKFLQQAGWAADGAHRTLDTGEGSVPQVRLHTDVNPGEGGRAS